MRTRCVVWLALVLATTGVAVAAEPGRYRGSTFELGSIRLTVANNRVTSVHYVTGMDCVTRGPGVESSGEDNEPHHEDVERTFRPNASLASNRFTYRWANDAGTRSYTLTGRVKGNTIRGTIREFKRYTERDGDLVDTVTCRGKDSYVARKR